MVEVASRLVDYLKNYLHAQTFQWNYSPKKTNEDELEKSVLKYVLNNVEPNDTQGVVDKIDEFGWKKSFLMNVGDVKGKILDSRIGIARPKIVLELGTYLGYSAIRMAKNLENKTDFHLYSIEKNEAYAKIARLIIRHAGLSHKITVIVGTLQSSLNQLRGMGVETVDFTLIDHFKHDYLPDLKLLMTSKLLTKGSVVFGDNILFPGAPQYLDYLEKSSLFTTEKIYTELEYNPLVQDMVTVSVFQGIFENEEELRF